MAGPRIALRKVLHKRLYVLGIQARQGTVHRILGGTRRDRQRIDGIEIDGPDVEGLQQAPTRRRGERRAQVPRRAAEARAAQQGWQTGPTHAEVDDPATACRVWTHNAAIVADVTSSSNSRTSIAVIPARGGSKRIPRKNVRLMNGRPLIAWAIDTAIASGEFSDVVVSTDDDEIAEIARALGASVPFVRPAELSHDHASTVSVVAHAVEHLLRRGDEFDLACCIYPAAILVTAHDLRGALAALLASSHDYASTVVRFGHPIQRALDLGADGALRFADPEAAGHRTQDLPPRWHDAGQVYWGRAGAWRKATPILPNSVGYELPSHRAVDIDTEDDWLRAERLHAVALGR